MPGKQLPTSLAANRPKRSNAGKNPNRDGAWYAEGIIRPAEPEDILDAESVGSPDVRLQEYLQEKYDPPYTPATSIPFPPVPSTPEATQPQTPGAP